MEQVDVIGVGAGPFNLSLAALAHPVQDLRTRFYEARRHFQWHPGLMLPEAEIQVSFIKDLVTLVDPTSKFSYLAFLAHKGRLLQSVIANAMGSSRAEFEQYYRWVAEQLPSIDWNQSVKSVSLGNAGFEVTCESGACARADTLVIGSGRTPYLPDCAAALRGEQVLHASEFMLRKPATAGRRVVLVGAGQSGAEVANYLLSEDAGLPASLTWVSSRPGFLPIDDSPFTNEWYSPAYVDHFRSLDTERRGRMLEHQRLSSDGISESLLRKIYRRIYQLDTVSAGRLRHRLVANHRMVGVTRTGEELVVRLHDEDRGREERCTADVVICSTGYRSEYPGYLEPLRDRLTTNGTDLTVRDDYSLAWNGPDNLRIYVQNFAESTHGIADPNLSLASWRSARILNSLLGREHYPLGHPAGLMSWSVS